MAGIANDPVTQLRGVGPKLASKLAEAGIYRVEDLLFHLPLRYQDRTRVTPIGATQEGIDVVIEGDVRVADVAFGRRCTIQDGRHAVLANFNVNHCVFADIRNLAHMRFDACFAKAHKLRTDAHLELARCALFDRTF